VKVAIFNFRQNVLVPPQHQKEGEGKIDPLKHDHTKVALYHAGIFPYLVRSIQASFPGRRLRTMSAVA
jgi:hypothetical protein